ncbi:hypothetical protein [Volucribacter amazonae]|uniref:Uncharacterized protein n=1 Tax=Volucribacter amazonae TaxID=256731 RepID=A0A9X4SMF9_9PAST|nr:hypothetical protein [Volucribacter amazonae]MDG6896068.1 hypothetical protein [Volucribacter amazonae]
MLVITTKEELEKAVKNKEPEFIVKGELAEQIKKSKKVKNLGKFSLLALSASIAAIPFTGGSSAAVGVATLSATTGLSIAALTAIICLGLTLLINLHKEYDLEYEYDLIKFTLKIKLTKPKN